MTLDNTKLALQLNNTNINQEINLIITYINQFATNQKILHYELDKRLNSIDNDMSQLDTTLTYQISLIDTKFTNSINDLSNDYGAHKIDTNVHITSAEREILNDLTSSGGLHTHSNKAVLDLLSVDNDGDLNYNGEKVGSGIEGDTTELEELRRQNQLLQEEIASLNEILDSINREVVE